MKAVPKDMQMMGPGGLHKLSEGERTRTSKPQSLGARQVSSGPSRNQQLHSNQVKSAASKCCAHLTVMRVQACIRNPAAAITPVCRAELDAGGVPRWQ
jgi:hypothetical protein